MDLTGAESVMALIAAEGRLSARTALAAREGAVFRCLDGVKTDLVQLLSGLSAFVDYPDDDIPELQPEELETTLREAKRTLTRLLATFDAGQVLQGGVDTVIVGCPNVGKSTLMNRLTGSESSIVTAEAGTTRDVVERTARLGEVLLRLADTAGIRTTDDTVEAIGVERARSRMQTAALVLAVFDGARPLTEEDLTLAEEAASSHAIAVINKADQPLIIDKEYIQSKFKHTVIISAAEDDGIEQLTAAVAEVTGVEQLQSGEPILATERQRDCACRSLAAVEEALDALLGGMTLDAVTVSVDDAVAAILELTGERVTETVVDDVFARFCVGK